LNLSDSCDQRGVVVVRAIGLSTFGDPDVLEPLERATPHPGVGQVRIRVRAAAVSPTDTLLRSGAHAEQLRNVEPPYIPGMDAAGEIDELGQGVDAWRLGDRVMAVVIPHRKEGGAYAEHIVVPADSVAAIPAGVDFVAASTLPMNGLTASATLDAFALAPGRTLAVTGAAGAYGGYVVQLAHAAGLRVIADAAPADEQLVAELGADVVVPRGDDVAAAIRVVCPDGVDALADGALLGERIVSAIRDHGQLAVVRGWSGPIERDIKVHSIRVHQHAREASKLDDLRRAAENGDLTLRVAATMPAAEAAQAHRQLAAGGVRGRIVLTF
jgi:NADPH2:quinone reductase